MIFVEIFISNKKHTEIYIGSGKYLHLDELINYLDYVPEIYIYIYWYLIYVDGSGIFEAGTVDIISQIWYIIV